MELTPKELYPVTLLERARSIVSILSQSIGSAFIVGVVPSRTPATSTNPLVPIKLAAATAVGDNFDILTCQPAVWMPDGVLVSDTTDEHLHRMIRPSLDAILFLSSASVQATGDIRRKDNFSSTAGQRGEKGHVDCYAPKGAMMS